MEETRMIEKEVVAEDLEVRKGLIGWIRAKRVHLERGGAAIISAEEQVNLNGGVRWRSSPGVTFRSRRGAGNSW